MTSEHCVAVNVNILTSIVGTATAMITFSDTAKASTHVRLESFTGKIIIHKVKNSKLDDDETPVIDSVARMQIKQEKKGAGFVKSETAGTTKDSAIELYSSDEDESKYASGGSEEDTKYVGKDTPLKSLYNDDSSVEDPFLSNHGNLDN